MAWFFTEPFEGQHHIIMGENAVHIEKSLRMKIGEALTLVDSDGIQYSCIIESFSGGCVEVRAEKKFRCENEPDVHITLYHSEGCGTGGKLSSSGYLCKVYIKT